MNDGHDPVVREVARRTGRSPAAIEASINRRWHIRLLHRISMWFNAHMSEGERWK